MRRLFIKLWITAVLATASSFVAIELISFWVHSEEEQEDELKVFAPGYLLAAKNFSRTPVSEREAALAELESAFGYPVKTASSSEVPADVPEQLSAGMPIAYIGEDEVSFAARIPDEDDFLVFGPVPPLPLRDIPSRAAILAVVAAAFALLFWLALARLGKAHLEIERAARTLAAGDFSARVREIKGGTASLAEAFNRMAERTETLIKSQRSLLRGVSHELRTPIARLRIGIDLLADTEDALQRKKRLGDLDRDLSDVDDLIEELLTHARLDRGAEPLAKASIDLIRTLEASIASVQPRPGVAVEIKAKAGGESLVVAADPKLFKRVVVNLVANAVKHARNHVSVDASKADDGVCLIVEDDGDGIRDEDRERAFEPFVRLGGEESAGYGLGLTLVREILRRHGGTVNIGRASLGGCRVETRWP